MSQSSLNIATPHDQKIMTIDSPGYRQRIDASVKESNKSQISPRDLKGEYDAGIYALDPRYQASPPRPFSNRNSKAPWWPTRSNPPAARTLRRKILTHCSLE